MTTLQNREKHKHQKRWQKAQQYEQSWWKHRMDDIELDYLKDYAESTRLLLKDYLDIDHATILEIGTGPVGIVNYLKGSFIAGIDPLERFFGITDKFKKARNPQVNYLCAKGENIPFYEHTFDCVISINVLDHCEAPDDLLAEIYRVLKPSGIFFLRIHTFLLWGKIVRKMIELFGLNPGHPHVFTCQDILDHGKALKISTVKFTRANFFRTWIQELTSKKLTRILKALLVITRVNTMFMFKK